MKIDGEKIKELREKTGDTQQQVSTKSNISLRTIGTLERDGGYLHPNHGIQLAKALGCKLWEIEVDNGC